MRLVTIENVKPNSYLGKTLYDVEGRVLLNSGVLITEHLIKKIKELNLNSLYILDDMNNYSFELIIKDELRSKSLDLIKGTFNAIDENNEEDIFLKQIYFLAEEILDEILSNDKVLYLLVDIKKLNSSVYDHTINVTILSLIIGISLKLSKYDLLNLCVGSLLHDIGKSFIDIDIIDKDGPLTYEEFEKMKDHCEKGYYHLKDNNFINNDCKMIILQHHERVDGMGYPKGLLGNQINKLAKIVAISDVYDTLTSDRYYIDSMCASDALEYIMGHADTIFDFEVVKTFSRVVVPFPNGTLVRLSNGDLGLVKETFRNFPLRPSIKILDSKFKETIGSTISLIDELSLVIIKIEKNVSLN
ncbi:HD domain-containing phosphohydrolase [Clostridium sp.]|uniref:HD-GYP domain-containing protein n=1 Tax=Clostridium sp. TaxID=1506 RepID=UPI00261BBD51|nr:HD domain-containing phosphohydrolase [Clostridium sp.]